MSIETTLSIISTIVATIALFPFVIKFIRIFFIRKTWKAIVVFFDDQLIINQWNNSSKSPNERIKEYIDILMHQGILWFMSSEIIDGFQEPFKYGELSIYKIKDKLKEQDLVNIYRIYKKWNLLKNKNSNIIQKLLNYEFVVAEGKYISDYIISYNLETFLNTKIKIEKTSITLINKLDILRLFSSKNNPGKEYKSEKVNLIELKKYKKNQNKNFKKELKNQDFIFNIRFCILNDLKISKDEKNNLNWKNSRNISVHFDKSMKINHIETIFDWDTLYKIDDKEELNYLIKYIEIVKSMFKIKNINNLILKEWTNINICEAYDYNKRYFYDLNSIIKIKKHFNNK